MVRAPQAVHFRNGVAPRVNLLAARVKRSFPAILTIRFDANSTWKLPKKTTRRLAARTLEAGTHAKGVSKMGSRAHASELAVPYRDEICNTPETRLMLAVLEDALATFRRGINSMVPTDRQCFREVEAWLRNGDCESPFSFECICWTLGMDPDYVRAGFYQVKRDAVLNRRPPAFRKIRRERVYDRRVWKGRIK